MINITFGKPIPYAVFDKRYSDLQWALKIKEFVYILKDNKNAEFTV